MPAFAPIRREVTIVPDAPGTVWDLEMLSPDETAAEPPGEFVSPPREPASAENEPSLRQGTAEVLLVAGSVNSGSTGTGASSAFGNNLPREPARYTGDLDLAGNSSALDARPFSLTGQNAPMPAYSGGEALLSLSGPLRIPFLLRDGPDFTLIYGRAQNRDFSLQSARVPTAAERLGDFRGHTSVLMDPVTGSPFSDHLVPQDRISPQARALLEFYPLPASSGGPGYNYQAPLLAVSHRDTLQFQSGGGIAGGSLSGSFAFQNSRSDSPNVFAFVDRQRTSTLNAALGWSRLLTENVSVFARFAFGRTVAQTVPHFANRRNVSGEAGIGGNSQDPRDWGPPNLDFPGGIAGLSDAPYAFDRAQSLALSYGSAWTVDAHALSAGGGFRREQSNVLSQQNGRGTFTFTGAASGIDFADFLLGIPTASSIAFGNADKYLRQSVSDAWVMDDWRITPELTLNFGLRWDYEAPVTERYGRLVNLDIAPGFGAATAVLGSQPRGPLTGRVYPESLVRPDKGGVQPRIGLAWRPFPGASTVIRAGYGVYRDSAVYRPIAAGMAQQSPLSTSMSVENSASTPLTLAHGFAVSPEATPGAFAIDPDFRVGRAENWHLSVQQDLPGAFQVTAAYLGTKGTRLPQRSLPNTFPSGSPDSCEACPAGFLYMTSNGSSNQHAGTIALRRRQRSGLSANVQYTWSKALDDSGLGGFHVAQDWQTLAEERALSNFDRRHQMTVQMFYSVGIAGIETPRRGWMDQLLGEWTVMTGWRVASGSPITPTLIAPVGGTGVTGRLRPDRTQATLYTGTPNPFLNPGAFSLPAPGQWGTAGRNSIAGPGQFSLDASIGRTFRTGEGTLVDVRVDVTNLLNRVTFPAWNTVVNSSQFGLPTGANPMRTIQPSLRVRF